MSHIFIGIHEIKCKDIFCCLGYPLAAVICNDLSLTLHEWRSPLPLT
jgi:hypothetical protein